MKGTFCIPFVFWNRSAQNFRHSPTAVVIQSPHLVTGSDTGEICIWAIDKESVTPRVIGTPGIQIPCKALAFLSGPFPLALDLETLVLSIHSDNRLRTWDVGDGKCVACSSDSLVPEHTRIDHVVSLESRLAALGGESKEILIVDCWIMSKVAVLLLDGQLMGMDYFEQGRMLSALTSESVLKFWSLPDYSRFLVKDANPPQVNQNCVIQMTVQTEEKPQGISVCPDGSLVALAYETTISFIHRSWVRAKQFSQQSRNEAYLRLEKGIKVMKLLEEKFYVLMADGNVGVYDVKEICKAMRIVSEPMATQQILPHHSRTREVQTYILNLVSEVHHINSEVSVCAFGSDFLAIPEPSRIKLYHLPEVVEKLHGSLLFKDSNWDHFSDEKVQPLLRSNETISTGNVVTTGNWPYYLLGTSLGKIFVMPMSQLYLAKWLDYHTSAISALYYSQQELISCSEDNLICLWDFDPEKIVTHDDSVAAKYTETPKERAKGRSKTVLQQGDVERTGEKKNRIPKLETRFPGTPIRTLIPVKTLSGTAEGVNEHLWKEWENTLLAQQADGSILLFSLTDLKVICIFQGVKSMIRSGFIHMLMEYLMIVDEYDTVYVFSMMAQALERQVSGVEALTLLRKEVDPGLVFDRMAATVSTAQNLVEFSVQFLACDKPFAGVNERFISIGGCSIPMLLVNVTQLQIDIANVEEFSGENGFLLSLLTDWRQSNKFQSQIRHFFKAQEPAVHCSAGVLGVAGTLALTLPNRNHWDTSSHIRSMLSTAIVRILSSALKFVPVGPVIHTVTDVLIHANLSPLSLAHEALQGILPARKLLLRTFRIRSPKERQAMARAWGRVLKRASQVTGVQRSLSQLSAIRFSLTTVQEQFMYVSLAQALGAVVLSCLLKEGVHITPTWSRALLKALNAMIRAEQPTYVALSCLCFAATYKDWDSLFPLEEHVEIRRELVRASNKSHDLIQTCAFKAFEKISQGNMQKLIEFLVTEMMQGAADVVYAKSLLKVAEHLLKRQSRGLIIILPLVVELLLRSLDPHEANLRKACIEVTQALLQLLVQKLPMSSFSQPKQRLAIGTLDAKVIIYDLKTASRWKLLEDHKTSVTAVAFNSTGTHIASYASQELTLKLWKLDGGFFEGIMGGNSTRPLHTYPLQQMTVVAAIDGLQKVKLLWTNSDQMIQLSREDGSEALHFPFPR